MLAYGVAVQSIVMRKKRQSYHAIADMHQHSTSWEIDHGVDGISQFSLRTCNIREKPYEVVSSSVWEENPETDGLVILDRD